MSVLLHLATVIGVLLAIMIIAAGLTYGERRLLALLQLRYGPNRVGPFGLLQVLADMIKIAMKEDRIPPFADRPVFIIAPAILLVATMLSFAVIPLTPGIVIADLHIGLLFILAMSSMSVYSIVLSGWSSNNKYALLGSIRAVGQMLSYEVFMGLSLMGVVMLAGSFSLGAIVQAQQRVWFCIPQVLGFAIFFVAALAETRRIPFDLPEAENELVAGYHTAYSGMKFAAFYLGEYIGITLNSALMTTLFFGGWSGPWLPPIIWFLGKMFVLIGLFILIRASLPRVRYDQLMQFGWKLMLPLALLNLIVTAAVVLLS